MIQLNKLSEMRLHLPPSICASVEFIVRETMELQAGENADDIPLVDVFGSPMFLVQHVEDLAKIRSFEEGPNGRLTILDAPSEWFDIARWDESGYAVFATVESANGGPEFFVPPTIAERAANVSASIALKAATRNDA